MSQAEALLASLSAAAHEHSHPVPDTDASFVIDPYSRLIENANYQKNVLMQRDHNSERFTFEIPRYVDGHDMSLCNRVIVHFDNISTDGSTMNSDVAYMTDLQLNPKNEETVISSWLITREATQIVGILSFSIQYLCVEADGTISYEWSTDSFEEIEIRKSKNNGEASVVKYSNVLEQWRQDIFGAGDSVMANITAEGENQVAAVQSESATQQAAIELKGSETLATIPEDYTEVYNMASEAVRTKADGVVCEAEGVVITVNDASDDYIRGLNVYGKTTQATTSGVNLFDFHNKAAVDGRFYAIEPDGSLKQIATDSRAIEDVPVSQTLPAGTYTAFIETFVTVDNNLHLQVYNATAGEQIFVHNTNKPVTFTLTEAADIAFKLYTSDHDACGKAQINAGDVALPYEPYTGGIPSPNPEYPQEIVSVENPTVILCGKNLWNHDYDITNMSNISGWGTAIWKTSSVNKVLKPSTTYTMSFDVTCVSVPEHETVFSDNCGFVLYSGESGGRYVEMAMTTGEGVFTVGETRKVVGTFKTPANVDDPTMKYEILRYAQRMLDSDDRPVNATVKFSNVQIEEGTTATEYEVYNGSYITLNRTINGIVNPFGNVVYDEVDLERGVYIQRLGDEVIDGSETVGVGSHANGQRYTLVKRQCVSNSSIMSDRYIGGSWTDHDKHAYILADNLVITDSRFIDVATAKAILATEKPRFVYALATPIETPLTAEEIEVYKSLKTNYPYTTVLNDSGAWMKVKYNADTKLYIDNAAVNGAATVVEEVLDDTY